MLKSGWRKVPFVATAVLLAFAGCGRGDKGSAKPEAPVDKTVAMNFHMEVTGDQSAVLDGKRDVRVFVQRGKGEARAFSVVSVTLPTPAVLPDGRVVSPELGIAGLYDKDGTYTVPAGLGTPPKNGPTVPSTPQGSVQVSVVHVTFLPHEGAQSEVRYGYVAEPCKVTYERKAMKGRAQCPALVSYDGRRVSMTLRWG